MSDAQEENAKLMIRAMIQAAKADGEIDDEERAKIMEHLGELEPEELAFVKAELAAPVDVNALAMDTGEQMKAQVYAMSLMAIRVDKASEAAYLDGLAAALALQACEDTARALTALEEALTIAGPGGCRRSRPPGPGRGWPWRRACGTRPAPRAR